MNRKSGKRARRKLIRFFGMNKQSGATLFCWPPVHAGGNYGGGGNRFKRVFDSLGLHIATQAPETANGIRKVLAEQPAGGLQP